MAADDRLVIGIFGDLRRWYDDLRLLVGERRIETLDRGGDGGDGPEHGGLRGNAGDRSDDGLSGRHEKREWNVRIEPTDILGGIALIGLLTYALLKGMDATIAGMLTGLFGVLLGRRTKGNGNGKYK